MPCFTQQQNIQTAVVKLNEQVVKLERRQRPDVYTAEDNRPTNRFSATWKRKILRLTVAECKHDGLAEYL
jgi:hypothetical protein